MTADKGRRLTPDEAEKINPEKCDALLNVFAKILRREATPSEASTVALNLAGVIISMTTPDMEALEAALPGYLDAIANVARDATQTREMNGLPSEVTIPEGHAVGTRVVKIDRTDA